LCRLLKEWKAIVAEVELKVFSMDVELKKQAYFHKEMTHFQNDNVW